MVPRFSEPLLRMRGSPREAALLSAQEVELFFCLTHQPAAFTGMIQSSDSNTDIELSRWTKIINERQQAQRKDYIHWPDCMLVAAWASKTLEV